MTDSVFPRFKDRHSANQIQKAYFQIKFMDHSLLTCRLQYLNLRFQSDFLEAFDDPSSLAQNIVDDMEGDSVGTGTMPMDGDDDEGVCFPIKEHIEAVKRTIQVADFQDTSKFTLLYHLRTLIRGLTRNKLSGNRQSTIKDFSSFDGLHLSKGVLASKNLDWATGKILEARDDWMIYLRHLNDPNSVMDVKWMVQCTVSCHVAVL